MRLLYALGRIKTIPLILFARLVLLAAIMLIMNFVTRGAAPGEV